MAGTDQPRLQEAGTYGGYDGVIVGNDITRAGCWAHARRKFVDAERAHPAIAAEAVGIIRRLYAVDAGPYRGPVRAAAFPPPRDGSAASRGTATAPRPF